MKITVKIGAAVEGDLGALLFAPMVEASKRAREHVRREMQGMAGDIERGG